MLEKLARGLVHRIFMAFVRYHQEMAEENAAQDAINARLAALDEANRAKLKVFLMGKEKQQMMLFFKVWVEVTQDKGMIELYELLDKEEALRKAAEEELAMLLASAGESGNALKELEDMIAAEEAEIVKLTASFKNSGSEVRRLTKQITDCERDTESEKHLRAEQQEKNAAVRADLSAVTATRDELAGELMGVASDVSGVHAEAQYEEE